MEICTERQKCTLELGVASWEFMGLLTETRLSLIGESTEEGFGQAGWYRKAQGNSFSSYLVDPVGI